MRPKIIAWAAGCCLLLSGSAAHAGTLTSATWVGNFQGTPFTLVTSGASLSASGTAVGTAISAVALTVAAPVLSILNTTNVPVFTSQTLGGSQTINSANVANQGVPGSVSFYIGTNSSTGTLLFPVALSVGVGGQFTTTAIVPGLNLPVEVTATFFPWTTGSQTLTGLTLSGVAAPDVVVSGSNSLASGNGSITLVSPTRLRLCGGPPFTTFPCIPGTPGSGESFTSATATRLTLNFASIPEPGVALLLSAGVVALAMRKRTH